MTLTYSDNGCGLAIPDPGPGGFGLRLVEDLAYQLGGTLTVTGEPGTTVELSFPATSQDRIPGD